MPPDNGDAADGPRVRPLWSGTVSFGLVTIPVDLYPAHRDERVPLRMLSPEGTPLRREYYNPETGKAVETGDVLRGYELDSGDFVIVSDEELEAVEPDRTRDIGLERFVERDALDPIHFDRAYFLTPGQGGAKAYRLLAEAMEREGRAGIARFVLRSREYLVAILANDGILRAETMRFADEVRSPGDVGLPETAAAPAKLVKRMRAAIRARAADALPEDELVNEQVHALRDLAESKRRAGEDVVRAPTGEPETGIIDLMDVLKRSLAGGGEERGRAGPRRAERSGRGAGSDDGRGSGGSTPAADELKTLTKDELYAMAQRMEIPGRSGMKKAELVRAIRRSA